MTGAVSIVRIVATAVVLAILIVCGPTLYLKVGTFELGSERPTGTHLPQPTWTANCTSVQQLAKVCR